MKSPYRQCRVNGKMSREHRELCREIYLADRMEYYLPFEKYVVHHRNGNKLDNSIKNLVLMTRTEHQRFHVKCQHRANGRFSRCA